MPLMFASGVGKNGNQTLGAAAVGGTAAGLYPVYGPGSSGRRTQAVARSDAAAGGKYRSGAQIIGEREIDDKKSRGS